MNLHSLKLIRELGVSAASGLVLYQGKIYVIADDELSLWVYPEEGRGEAEVYPLLPGTLPEQKKERKKVKPDFESLVRHESMLIAIPSGSKPNRHQAILIYLGPNGSVDSIKAFSLEKTFSHLAQTYSELNIEGAVILKENIYLFQRGNGSLGKNGIVSLPLVNFLADRPENINSKTIDLGSHDGINLSFTDACLGEEKMVFFLAVAEASESTYEDGAVTGCMLGQIDVDSGEIISRQDLDLTSKPEGLDFDADKNIFYLVTDDDDRSLPAKLYSILGGMASGSKFRLKS